MSELSCLLWANKQRMIFTAFVRYSCHKHVWIDELEQFLDILPIIKVCTLSPKASLLVLSFTEFFSMKQIYFSKRQTEYSLILNPTYSWKENTLLQLSHAHKKTIFSKISFPLLTFDTGFLPLAEALSGFLSFLCDKGGKSYIATVLLETSVRHPFSRGDTISKETKGNNCLAIPIFWRL